MANAYATIASGGWRNQPKAITKVRFPDGKIDDLGKPQRSKQFDSGAMYEVVKILEQNIKAGTGRRAATGCPAGGKTGTTDANRNAWFAGFSPKLASAVWVGFPEGDIAMPNLFNGGPVDGGTFPAQIWGTYMKSAQRGFCGSFEKPDETFQGSSQNGFRDRGAPGGAAIDPRTGRRRVPPPLSTPPAPPPRGTPNGGFDPDTYNSRPQTPPPVPYTPGTPIPRQPPPNVPP